MSVDMTVRQAIRTCQEPAKVSAVVRHITDQGIYRERAVSRVQREIAAGNVILTDAFMLELPPEVSR